MPDPILDAVRHSGAPRGTVQVTRYAPHVPKLVRNAAAVVSMCGYNSMAEVMATTTPALVVPRNSRRAEQPRRAAALTAAGAVETLSQEQLSSHHLTAWFAKAVSRRTLRDHIDLDGLTRIGDIAAHRIGAGFLRGLGQGHRIAPGDRDLAALRREQTRRRSADAAVAAEHDDRLVAQVQLVEDLFDVSRIITGKLRLETDLISISSIVENAVEAVRPAAEAKNGR